MPRPAAQLAVLMAGKELPDDVSQVLETVRHAMHSVGPGQHSARATLNRAIGQLRRRRPQALAATKAWLETPEVIDSLGHAGAPGLASQWSAAIDRMLSGEKACTAFGEVGRPRQWRFSSAEEIALAAESRRRQEGLTLEQAVSDELASRGLTDSRNVMRVFAQGIIRDLSDEDLNKLRN